MLSGAIEVKTATAAALEVVMQCHFKSKQLISCLLKNKDASQLQQTGMPKNLLIAM